MIYGLKHYLDKRTYYVQTNNPTEEILRKEDGKGFLETCGPTTAINCLAAIGKDIKIKCPGTYSPQPEEVLSDFFNDPANYDEFEKIRKGLNYQNFFNNRVPQLYPFAIKSVFNVKARFEWQSLNNMEKLLKANVAIMVCLLKPSHYVAIVAYDKTEGTICIRDPWPNSPIAKGNGFNKWIKQETLFWNLEEFRILIGV